MRCTLQKGTTHSRFLLLFFLKSFSFCFVLFFLFVFFLFLNKCAFHIGTFTSHDFIEPQQLFVRSPGCCSLTSFYRLSARVVREGLLVTLVSESAANSSHILTVFGNRGTLQDFSPRHSISSYTKQLGPPHQRSTLCTSVSMHTCVQVPKLNIHASTQSHSHTHTHTSPYYTQWRHFI